MFTGIIYLSHSDWLSLLSVEKLKENICNITLKLFLGPKYHFSQLQLSCLLKYALPSVQLENEWLQDSYSY
jgi:hypothetical protein